MKRLFKNFLKYRYLLRELIKKDIKLKYRRSYLGILWTLLEPLFTMIVLTLVFSGFYGKSDKTFPVYILTGRLLFTFFSNSTKAATKSIRSNAGMIKKVYVPKYIYPISTICSNFIFFLISLIVLVAVALVLGVYPTKYVFFAVVPILNLLACHIFGIFQRHGVSLGNSPYPYYVLLCHILRAKESYKDGLWLDT